MQQWDKKLMRTAGSRRAVAFDVFDTLLLRDVAQPKDLFAMMEQTGQAAPGYCDNRTRAEAMARSPGKETTLAQIYAQAPLHGVDPGAECRAELGCVVPNPDLVRAARACHDQGYQVYIISDMYLPAAQIREMLCRCGVDFADGIFVSSDYGVQKRSGKLFRLFLQKTGLRARDVLFVGNDRRVDWGGAAMAGIRCVLVPPVCPPAYYPAPQAPQQGALWAFLRNRIQGMGPEQRIGYGLIGPMLTAFAAWLHTWRQRHPTARLVMLARDMDLVRRIYATMYPEEPQAVYLKVSRRSLCPALLQRPMNEEGVALLADALPRQHLSAAQVLEYCGFAPDALPVGTDDTVDLCTRPLTRPTKDFLLGIAALSKTSTGVPVRRQAELARRYLSQQLPADGTPILLVDIGSGGTTQRALKALGVGGMQGACLACDKRLHEYLDENEARAFLFDGGPAPLWYWVAQPMLERLISESAGPTVGYEVQGRAVAALTGETTPDPLVEKIQEAALWFARDWRSGPWESVGLPVEYISQAFLTMVRDPSVKDAALLGSLAVEDGGTWNLAAPQKRGYYLRHPRRFGKDLRDARWKNAFLRLVLPLPLPYDRLYVALAKKRGRSGP